MSSEEKSEEPTDHKLREARKKGEVATSRDLTGAVAFLAVMLLLANSTGYIGRQLRLILDASLNAVAWGANGEGLPAVITQMVFAALWVVGPVLLLAVVVTLLVGLAQTRGMFSTHPVNFKPERMNPAQAFKQLFSTKQLGVLVQMIFKAGALLTIIAWTLRHYLNPMASGMYWSIDTARAVGLESLNSMFLSGAAVFLVLGIVDYIQQCKEHIKANRMSKTETKREWKDLDGDPKMKWRLKQDRKEILESPRRPRSLADAQVVVTNPTHFAVALYYEPGVVELPVVVAKGHDAHALAMRRQAQGLCIPVLESPPLARSLHRHVELGECIGDQHLAAVAEVFRWLRRIKTTDEAKPKALGLEDS